MDVPIATKSVAPSPEQIELLALLSHLEQEIVGQRDLLVRMLIALLADGHLLVEGAPGLAKTKAIKALAKRLEGDFHRVQFTPDLLPADLTGTDIYRPQDAQFEFQPGPLFHNFLLADEVNRAPAKVQSALLEAMAEHQITVGSTTYALPTIFLVMATQNPIEQEGTYPLPEAQLDRFLMQVNVDYPSKDTEKQILRVVREETRQTLKQANNSTFKPLSQSSLLSAREQVLDIYLAEPLEDYIIELVTATRDPQNWSAQLSQWIRFGASPRGTLAIDRCARAHAWLQGRNYVSPEDIHQIAPDVLRHRILLSFEAEAEGVNSDYFIHQLLQTIPIP
jgi:MoxR-like ATPase